METKKLIKIAVIVTTIFLLIWVTPIKKIFRPAPQKAMEKYLQRRYKEDFTLVTGSLSMSSKHYLDFDSKNMSWHAKYKCAGIDYYSVNAYCTLKEDGFHYKCGDDYEIVKKQSELRNELLKTVPEIVGDKCYVWIEYDSGNKTDYPYYITIYVKSITKEKARDVVEKVIALNSDKGIYCEVAVYEYYYNEEGFASTMTEDPGDFLPTDPTWDEKIYSMKPGRKGQ